MNARDRRFKGGFSTAAALGALVIAGVALSVGFNSTARNAMSNHRNAQLAETREILREAARILSTELRDVDGDGVFEPIVMDTGSAGVPANGGFIPASSRAVQRDAWGTRIGYCAFDHGTVNVSIGRLAGSAGSHLGQVGIALISAGMDQRFDTSCANVGGAVAAGAMATNAAPTFGPGGDDIIERVSVGKLYEMSAQWVPLDDGTGDQVFRGVGNLGIGTNAATGPQAKLDVQGTANVDGTLTAHELTATTSAQVAGAGNRLTTGTIATPLMSSTSASLSKLQVQDTLAVNNTLSCPGATPGTLRINGSSWEFCNGVAWTLPAIINNLGTAQKPITGFSFATVQTEVLNTQTCSAPTTPGNFIGTVAVIVSGGTGSAIRIAGGPPITGGALLSAGQTLQACVNSGGSLGITSTTTVQIGTQPASFSVQTADTSPAAFSFTNLTGQPLNSTITSNTVSVSGFTATLTASCSGCTAIARNGVWTAGTSLGGFVPGDTIAIRTQTGGSTGQISTINLTLGTTAASPWTVRT